MVHASESYEHAGLRLHYTHWNPGGERTAVLLHGLNVQSHTWDPVAAELAADGYRVLCPDLRGHGRSDWSRDGYYAHDFAADVAALVDQLELPAFDLIGHSLGCRVGLVYADGHPGQVRRLVLSDAGPEFPPAALEFAERVVSAAGGTVRGFDDEAEARAYYDEQHPEWQPIFRELHVRHQLRRNWAGKLVFRADPDLWWLLGPAGREDDPRIWQAVDRLAVPTLILWGERSPFFSAEIAERMLARMADGRLVRTPTGHYIPREAPDEFLRAVRDFLAA
jgi:pimeloyl-ACP methyl ester carboxylesterase